MRWTIKQLEEMDNIVRWAYMSFKIETISEEGHEDYEIWTCKNCGRSITTSVGADVACCPCEFDGEGD